MNNRERKCSCRSFAQSSTVKGFFSRGLFTKTLLHREVESVESVIEQNLIKQVEGSVRWTQSIELLDEGTLCIEVGPGKVISGLVNKIKPSLKVISTEELFSRGTSGVATRLVMHDSDWMRAR